MKRRQWLWIKQAIKTGLYPELCPGQLNAVFERQHMPEKNYGLTLHDRIKLHFV
jgi:hypothetical protein